MEISIISHSCNTISREQANGLSRDSANVIKFVKSSISNPIINCLSLSLFSLFSVTNHRAKYKYVCTFQTLVAFTFQVIVRVVCVEKIERDISAVVKIFRPKVVEKSDNYV